MKKNRVSYKLLKAVSIKAIEESGACERELHRFTFEAVKKFGIVFYGTNFPSVGKLIELAQQCKGGIQFLIDHGFIAEDVEQPDIKVDDLILVSDHPDSDDYWIKRHFAKWGKRGVYVWSNGATSWSAPEGDKSYWEHWKIPEEK